MKIPWAQPFFGRKERQLVADALRSTWISDGKYIRDFEEDFAGRHGVRFCITTSSGTSALLLALLAVGAKAGDEIIVPGFTFIAPVNMVLAAGAKPVYADIDPFTWCVDAGCVERQISPRTKAVIAVHLYGNVCAMTALRRIARRHNLYLIEDAAEAAFSRYRGKPAGTFGAVGCFSFQATKTITMGEGGCVLTSNKKLHDKMRVIRDHGMSRRRRYWHDVQGYNFRLTNMQAALGCAQLKNLKKILSAKRRVYASYQRYLKGETGIAFQSFSAEVEPVVWCVAVALDTKVFKRKRDDIMKSLGACGIETRPGFYPASVMPFYSASPLPVAERTASRVITLPSYAALTDSEIRYVCDRLKGLRK